MTSYEGGFGFLFFFTWDGLNCVKEESKSKKNCRK